MPWVVSGAPGYLQKQLAYPPFPVHHLVRFGAADTLERGALKRAQLLHGDVRLHKGYCTYLRLRLEIGDGAIRQSGEFDMKFCMTIAVAKT